MSAAAAPRVHAATPDARAGRRRPAQPKELQRWVSILLRAYNVMPLTEQREAFQIVLGHFTSAELRLAFTQALNRHNSNFPPAPGQVLAYYTSAYGQPAADPAPAGPHANCAACHNTGWRVVDRDGETAAVPCREPVALGPSSGRAAGDVKPKLRAAARVHAFPAAARPVVEVDTEGHQSVYTPLSEEEYNTRMSELHRQAEEIQRRFGRQEAQR